MARAWKIAGVALAAMLLGFGGLVAFGAFNLTGTGQVNVTAPLVSAAFVSGQVAGKTCTVSGSGNSLSCPSISLPAGNETTLTFSIKNTGSQKVNLDIQVVPVNATVLNITPGAGSGTVLAPDSIGTYAYTIYCLNVGNAAFTISVTPAPLPPQS
jgi:hypothetical protein